MELLREFLGSSSFFNEVDCLVEVVISILKPRTIMNDDSLVLDAECDFLPDVVPLSLVVNRANLDIR